MKRSTMRRERGGILRREFLASAGLAAAAAVLVPRELFAQEESIVDKMRREAASAKITIEKLRGNISVLLGSGGNIAVLGGGDGKLLVDAGIAGSRPRISEALGSLGREPVKHVLNTHWHFDHTDGNEWLHSTGANVVAHENTRKRLTSTVRVDDWNFTFPPAPSGALPAMVFSSELSLYLNGTAVEAKYYKPCHTDTDIAVKFVEADIFHCGDTWWNGFYPFIDYKTGGSINGMVRAAEINLAAGGDKTIYVPGHGPVGDKKQLTEFRDMLVAIRDKIARLKKQGKTIDEVLAAKPTADYDEKYGKFIIAPSHFTRLVYAGV